MRLLTAGFSHGSMYSAVLEGLPAGIEIDTDFINEQLARRQKGRWRSARQLREHDKITIFSGVIDGKTTGAPLAFGIENVCRDRVSFTAIRSGHADYPAAVKYGYDDLSIAAERASARETVNVVAAGAICRLALAKLGIEVTGVVQSIGGQSDPREWDAERAGLLGDTVGGMASVFVSGVFAGLGGGYSYDRKLDGRLAAAIVSLPSVKAVSFGWGDYGLASGLEWADKITENGRESNHSGGIDGGMANGDEIVIGFAVKPVPTTGERIATVDIVTKKATLTPVLRSDICVVDVAAVCAEAAVAIVIFDELQICLGGDTLEEMAERIVKKRKNDFLARR